MIMEEQESCDVPEHMVAVKKSHLILRQRAAATSNEHETTSSAAGTTAEIDNSTGNDAGDDDGAEAAGAGQKTDSRDNRNNRDRKEGGRNKKRPRESARPGDDADRLCHTVLKGIPCTFPTCSYSHDPLDYLSRKPADIGSLCYQYATFGVCSNGIMCRYGGQHIDYTTGQSLQRSESEGGVIERVESTNVLKKDVQLLLRKKQYPYSRKDRKDRKDDRNNERKAAAAASSSSSSAVTATVVETAADAAPSADDDLLTAASTTIVDTAMTTDTALAVHEKTEESTGLSTVHEKTEESTGLSTVHEKTEESTGSSTVHEKTEESTGSSTAAAAVEAKEEQLYDLHTPYDSFVKLVDFSNKVYVAPLTTVGNLPFRRVMKDFGADITCGEMAMSLNLCQGQASEWALLRRHPSEKEFGIQVAASQPDHMSQLAQLLENETSSTFVDLNSGCPIDTITSRGCGSALLMRPKKLVDVVQAMCTNLPSRQVTVKIRTGWDDKAPMAHKLIPMLQKMSKGRIAAVMIHGRSRAQRYNKNANWDYIFETAQQQDPDYPRIPVIGNGDIFSWDDWKGHLERMRSDDTGGSAGLCDCAMIGRGALIKPWLPQEIKEQRMIDISAPERLEMLKTFVNYGLEHWGSDTQGLVTTRRFLLEWLSFLHRYVPIGLTERIQKMQQRPPHYFGRCDLETLLASSNSNDWVRISEMLLGPVGDGFAFLPKHKSNSYAPEAESNG